MNVDPGLYGKLSFLLASPACTHHSKARGGAPINDQQRTPARKVIDWVWACRPEFLVLENVSEFQDWAPLTEDGDLDKELKGKLFEQYILDPLKALGYSVDFRVLCCADYGDPTTRERLFLVARRDGRKVTWPEQTHARSPEYKGLQPWVPARDIIDWSIPGKSIFDRKKPLSQNTIRRIVRGIEKYWGEWAQPFVMILRGESNVRCIDLPVPTLTTGQHIGLVTPFITKYYGTSDSCSIGEPVDTITAGGNKFGLLQPMILGQQSASAARTVSGVVPTIACAGAISLLQPFITKYYGAGAGAVGIDDPLDTVTTKGRFGIVTGSVQQDGSVLGLDLLYRMLQPHELAAAMSFPKDYIFTGTKTEVIKQIGNAVPVCTARALIQHQLFVHGLVAV